MRSAKSFLTTVLRLTTALVVVAFSLAIETPSTTAWRSTTPQVNATYFGGTSADYAYMTAIDASGNHFVLGGFEGTTDFDPGTGTTQLSSYGYEDIYISKFNSSGDFVWVKRIGGTGQDSALAIALDSSGDFYIGGSFQGSPDFDPGVGISSLTTNDADAFILKLNSNGDFQWVKRITGPASGGGIFNLEYVKSLAVTSAGLYASGEFNGTADFDPGDGTSNLVSNGGNDVFVVKLDLSGNFQWVKSFGASDTEIARSLAADSTGVYVAGGFRGTVNFNPAGSANLSSPDISTTDAFLVKLDDQGSYQWATNVGNDVWGVAVDVAGGYVYSTGTFWGTQDFDPGSGTSNLSSLGSDDAYLLTLNTDGSFVRVVRFGTSNLQGGRRLAVDSSGNVFATGTFTTTGNSPVDFDPGAGTTNLLAPDTDLYVVKLTRAGSFVWARQFGGWLSTNESIWAVTVDLGGNAVVSGSFVGTIDVDTSADGSVGAVSNGSTKSDAFVAQMASSSGYTDTTAPTGSLQNKTIRASTRSYGHSTTEGGQLYLVRDSVVVTDLASITNSADADWNVSGINLAGSNVPVVSDGLRDGIYYAYGVDRSRNFSARYSGSITIDSTTPVPTLTISRSGSGTLTAGQTTTLTITSSEELAGMFNSYITKSAGTIGTLSRVTGTTSWTGTFTPPANAVGTASISIAANRAADLDNNGNEATSILSIDYDTLTNPSTTTTAPTTTTTVAPTTTTTTTVAPTTTTTTTTVAPTTTATSTTSTTTAIPRSNATVVPETTTTVMQSTTTVAPTTTAAKPPYKDWTVSASPSTVSPADSFSLEVSVTCPNKMNNVFYSGSPTGTPLFRYDLVSTSGSRVVSGGYAWRGTQTLSNDNYTVKWTQSVKAPSSVGTYIVQVYSVGAAADYIYCKMQMNARTDGPKTSLTVTSETSATTTALSTTTTSIAPSTTPTTTTVARTTTTTTLAPSTTTIAPPPTTTVPALPIQPDALARVDLERPLAVVDGNPVEVEVVESPASLEVTVGGVVATVGGISGGSNPLALTENGEVEVSTEESVRFSLTGFQPNSKVDLWLYTRDKQSQAFLGSFLTSERGVLSEEIQIPVGELVGAGDLVISGTNKTGQQVSIGVPIQVVQVARASGFTRSLLAGLLLSIGGFFMFLLLRRRDNEIVVRPRDF
jgi:hypothetical protein